MFFRFGATYIFSYGFSYLGYGINSRLRGGPPFHGFIYVLLLLYGFVLYVLFAELFYFIVVLARMSATWGTMSAPRVRLALGFWKTSTPLHELRSVAGGGE